MRFARSIIPELFLKALTGAFLVGSTALALGQTVQVYDTEIETIIRLYTTPVFSAAGIEPGAVRIHLVRSDEPNAFVARGQRLFVTTGLLQAAENPGQVIGVLAHETGHIAGGHLARLDTMMRDASTPALLTTIVAAALGALSRNPGVAIATMGAGTTVINRRLLSFNRAQEQSADRAAVFYLEQTGQSAKGLLRFLEYLDDQQALIISRESQQAISYDVTHPLTGDRIAYLRNHVERSKYSDSTSSVKLVAMHARMVAKLDGFMEPPARTLKKYQASDGRLAARYARAIALYRKPETETALAAVSALIAQHPEDPYFQELKGQILFESGRIEDAVPYFQRAVNTMPEAPLLRIGLAQAQIELNRDDLIKPALAHLKVAMRDDDTMVLVWYLAATAYGRSGKLGDSALASAEYAFRTGRHADAIRMAERAKRLLKAGSPGGLRAEDLLATLKRKRPR